MRPTKGEISVTPASAQATAWCRPKSSVRLQWMPSFSSCSAARMPSQVEAILMRMRSRVDAGRLVLADELARLVDGRLGVEREARVDLGRDAAGDDLEDPQAELDAEAVDGRLHDGLGARAGARFASSPSTSASSTIAAYSGICAAAVISDGLVVASRGRNFFDGLDVAGVGDHDGHGLELLEEGRHGWIQAFAPLIVKVREPFFGVRGSQRKLP